MKKILFICVGNVARSQMAEAYYNYFVKRDYSISAGVLDFTFKKYGSPTKEVIHVMGEDGIDVSKNVVKTVNPELIAISEKVIILCKKEECPDFLFVKNNTTFWNIMDPFGESIDTYRVIRDQIKEKVLKLLT